MLLFEENTLICSCPYGSVQPWHYNPPNNGVGRMNNHSVFQGNGYLSAGFHEWSVVELEDRLVTSFPTSTSRRAIFDWFQEGIIGNLTDFNLDAEVWLGGSFVSAKNDPNDIDVFTIFDYRTFEQLDDMTFTKRVRPMIEANFLPSPEAKYLTKYDSYSTTRVPTKYSDKYREFKADYNRFYRLFRHDRANIIKGIVRLHFVGGIPCVPRPQSK